ncbi:hypothetical protein [Sphingobium yanoikuyae]|uniref:hypothetical protein n=1 Tax=Sphingobium yanoikuyae TaxID=13690 RepID=UPI0028AF0274|nr:hypothetical protein [Sphingobium yanoikuyae]
MALGIPETKWGPTSLPAPTNVGSFRPHALAGCAFRSGDMMRFRIFAQENEPEGLFTVADLSSEARRSLSRVPGIILKGLDPIVPAILAHGSSQRTIRAKKSLISLGFSGSGSLLADCPDKGMLSRSASRTKRIPTI